MLDLKFSMQLTSFGKVLVLLFCFLLKKKMVCFFCFNFSQLKPGKKTLVFHLIHPLTSSEIKAREFLKITRLQSASL